MDKKEILKLLEEAHGIKPKYMGPPSFSYQIKLENDCLTVDRNGLIWNAVGEELKIENIMSKTVVTQNFFESDDDVLELVIPLEGHLPNTIRNLMNMIMSKQQLIMKALEINDQLVTHNLNELINKDYASMDSLNEALRDLDPINLGSVAFNFEEGSFRFSIKQVSAEYSKAFIELLALVNKTSKELKYASAKEKQSDNEKYAFRTWLLRLGMIGDQYKTERKTLLKNLEGNASFRTVKDPDIGVGEIGE